MSIRTFDWTPLGWDTDPVPGNPSTVEEGGLSYQGVATSINTAAKEIDAVPTAAAGVSEALDSLRERLAAISTSAFTAEDRYSTAGLALVTYADQLASAQRLSLEALDAARLATDAEHDARQQANYYTRLAERYTELGDAAGADRCVSLASAQHRAAEAAVGDLADAKTTLATAISTRDDAARTLRAQLSAAMDDGLNDGWWENWGSDVANVVSDIAGTIAAAAGIASLVLCWVPGLGQLLAGIAVIAGVVALASDTLLAAHGEKSWGDVAWSAAGVAAFGAGRLAAPLFRSLAQTSNGPRATTLITQVTRGPRTPTIRHELATTHNLANGTSRVMQGMRAGGYRMTPSAVSGDVSSTMRATRDLFGSNGRTILRDSWTRFSGNSAAGALRGYAHEFLPNTKYLAPVARPVGTLGSTTTYQTDLTKLAVSSAPVAGAVINARGFNEDVEDIYVRARDGAISTYRYVTGTPEPGNSAAQNLRLDP